ncbi:MAG: hypothetical protein ACREBP_03025, partial [Sphingomicrobium sp.]
MNGRIAFMLLVGTLAVTAARSGHELPIYPSYYPHEIEIRTVTPERAAGLLLDGKIHAYIAGAPNFAGALPESIGAVESLGSFVLVRINPASPLAQDERSVCTVAETILRDIAGKSGMVFHPYPVTPWHGDYLHHADLADAAKARLRGDAPAIANLRVKAAGGLAKSLVRPDWHAPDTHWDAEVAEIGASDLVAGATAAMNGWLGPPWLRTGWFHAHLLLGGTVDAAARDRVEAELHKLQSDAYRDSLERLNTERQLVTSLAAGCRTMVAGYSVKREYFNAEFSAGIENVAYDAFEGLSSPMFIRTVKLKDFPWNGWLALGIDAQPLAAWNPIAGFSDQFGRLMWFGVA